MNPSGASAGPLHALIVDDDPQLSRLMGRLLERVGFSVNFASTSHEAEEQLAGRACSLWLLDATVLPHGAEGLLRRAAETEPRPGVLLTSGASPETALMKALDAVGGRFLPKPFSPAEFRRLVSELSAPNASTTSALAGGE